MIKSSPTRTPKRKIPKIDLSDVTPGFLTLKKQADINESLLLSPNSFQVEIKETTAMPQAPLGCWYKFGRAMGWRISEEERVIDFSGTTNPASFPSNKLKNTKYNIITFLPIVLWNQFKFFFNMFFLILALS